MTIPIFHLQVPVVVVQHPGVLQQQIAGAQTKPKQNVKTTIAADGLQVLDVNVDSHEYITGANIVIHTS